MVNSIQNNHLAPGSTAQSKSPIPPEIETIKQVFNETVNVDHPKCGLKDFEKAVYDYDVPQARKIMEKTMEADWKLVQEAYKKAESIDLASPNQDLLSTHDEKNLKLHFSRGYEGHNNLFIHAILTSDFKEFVRVCMDNDDRSWLNHQEPETLRSLLHLAVSAGQFEIVYYLLLQGADLELKDHKSLTVKQFAEENGRKYLIDFIDDCQAWIEFKKNPSDVLKEKIESIHPEMREILNEIEEYIVAYKEVQKSYFTEDGKLTDEGKAKKDFSKHGLVRHVEESQGHNGLIVESIIEGNVEKLAAYVKMGAALDTLSIPVQKAIQNPDSWLQSYSDFTKESMNSLSQDLKATAEFFMGEDKTVWSKNPGVGKTVLDLAVIYSNENQDNLDVIAYLMHKGLDPFRTNDEGESPFSIALTKGNLKVALLMMGHKQISEEKVPQINEETLNKAFLILKEGANMRDPLYVNSSKTRSGIFAGAYLLAHHAQIQSTLLNWINFFSFAHRTFSNNELNFREKLNIQSEKALYLPNVVKHILPTAAKASVLEIAVMPQYQVGTMATTALDVYSGVNSTFSSLKTACSHFGERPLSAMYKVGMDLLPTSQSVLRFKYFFSTLVYYPAKHWLYPVNPDDYKSIFSLRHLDSEELNPNCREHAKIIAGNKWDQADYEKDPNGYLEQKINKIPTHLLGIDRATKIAQAYVTLSEPEGNFSRDTAYKAGAIFAANQINFGLWGPLSKASIYYHIGSSIWRSIVG